jgi:hypothetical protein
MLKLPRPRLIELLCVVISAVFAGVNVVWLFLGRLPPNWDDAWYLTNSLTVYDSLVHRGIAGYLSELNSVFGFKAPLIAALPAPFYLLLGRRWHAAYLVNIVCMLSLCWALHRIASRWWGERAALLAIVIVGTMPLLYGLSRWYLVEYPLATLLGVSILILIESDALERRNMALLFGVACGLGVLLKVSFAAFVLPVFLYFLLGSRSRLRSLVLVALPFLFLAMPWYAGHLRPVLANALDAGFGKSAGVQGTGPVLALSTIRTYLSHVIVDGTSTYYAILTIALLAWLAWRSEGHLALHGLGRKPATVLFLWLLPFSLFIFGVNKDIRYIAPVLPGLALLIAYLLDSALPSNPLRAASLGLLFLVFPIANLFSVSFGIPYRAKDLTYARRFMRRPWPLDEMLLAIADNTNLRPRDKELLLVGADRAAFNANNVELAATALKLPFTVETTAHESDIGTLRLRLAQASYFLYKDGGEPESPTFNPHIAELVQLVITNPRYIEVFARRLPDGGTARIFKNSTTHSPPLNGGFFRSGTHVREQVGIDFGGMLALTGISTVKALNSMTIQFRWRCLRPPDRDYWCFTHLINADGKIVAQLDHRLLSGDPPLLSWREGDAGIEEIRLLAPVGAPMEGLRLRFGFYDPPSRDRLRVGAMHGVAASGFTLADQATAVVSVE